MILTAKHGTNADLIPDVFSIYIEDGWTIADVTYGKGAFWTNIDKTRYNVLETDIQTGVDFRNLPYDKESIDCLILDPPYMHTGGSIKESINDCYKNNVEPNTSHASVIRLYSGGILEASRVLRKRGLILIKCQDEIESGKQCWSHNQLMDILEHFGFKVLDLFILMSKVIPAQRWPHQKHARKNHSYLIVAEFLR